MKIKALATLFVFAIVFVICFLCGWQSVIVQASEFHGGEGTSDNPYQVSTAEQLNLVRNYLDAHFIQVADIDMASYLAEAGAGYNEGEGWLPIGTFSFDNTALVNGFKGTYDGQDYKIINLYINRPDLDNVGLFGYVGENAVIKAVHLEAANVTGHNSVGSLVGRNNSGSVERCSVTGSILAKGFRVGGLLGTNQGRLNNCYSRANVKGLDNIIGGLVGAHEGKDARMHNSYSTGFIDQPGKDHPGGLIGYMQGNESIRISNSFYDKNTSGRADTGKGVGKTTAEMKQQATYIGWNFDTIWDIDENVNDGYPYLRIANPDRIGVENGSDTEDELSTNAYLRELTVFKVIEPVEGAEVDDSIGLQISMQPEFNHDVFDYEISVTESVYQVRLRAVADDDTAVIKINDIEVESGQYSQSITLNIGENIMTVLSIAEDGINRYEYNIVINRIQNPPQEIEEPQEPQHPQHPEEPEESQEHEEQQEDEHAEEQPSLDIDEPEQEDVITTVGNAIEYESIYDNAPNFEYDPLKHMLRIAIDAKNYIQDVQQRKITINLDDLGVVEAIASIDTGVIIEITINDQIINAFAVEISSDTAAILADKSVSLYINANKASYKIPIKLITEALADVNMPSDASLDSTALDSIIHIEIAKLNVENIINPTEFRVYTIYGSETVEVNQFSEYLVREIILSSDIDNGTFANNADLTRRHIEQTYSGVMLANDGSLLHIPTLFVFKDGVWRAQMQSMSNSIYGIATREEVTFVDLDGHYARNTIIDLASKRIVKGVAKDGNRYFYPNESVTYAEFIALLTRAMGLYRTTVDVDNNSSGSSDVNNGEKNWYEESVQAAIFYKLIDSKDDVRSNNNSSYNSSGSDNMELRLQRLITRQEASELIRKVLIMITVNNDGNIPGNLADNILLGDIANEEAMTRVDAAVIIRELLSSFWDDHIKL